MRFIASLTGSKSRKNVFYYGHADMEAGKYSEILGNRARPCRISHWVPLMSVVSQEEYILWAK